MDSEAIKRYFAERKGPTVPFFLQSKPIQNKYVPENKQVKQKKIANASKQFQEFIFIDQKKKNSIYRRVHLTIKNTPKVIIIDEESQKITVLIQSPKKLFIQHLKPYRKSVQVSKIIEIVITLFQLVQVYGYFYCDTLFLRVSQNGSPIVWINQRFQQNQRQYPIRTTSVSQLIFVKKITQILNTFIVFPATLQTKNHILLFLEQTKVQFQNSVPNFPHYMKKGSDIQITPQKKIQQSKFLIKIQTNKTYIESKSPRSIKQDKIICQKIANTQLKEQSFDQNSQNPRKYSRKMYQVFQMNRSRTKTATIQRINQYKDQHISDKKQKSLRQHKSKGQSRVQKSLRQHKSRGQSRVLTSKSGQIIVNEDERTYTLNQKKSFQSQQNQEEQNTLYDQFNFQQDQLQTKKSFVHDKVKSRKQSFDINLNSLWLNKNQKKNQGKFPHSTFSPRMTFTQLKTSFYNTMDNELPKERKTQSKLQNHFVPHLYPQVKQKQIKEKLSISIKKIMKESGMKISEENSFQNEMQSLLDSCNYSNGQKKQFITKQSVLLGQFQKLFDSNNISEAIKELDTRDIESIFQ